MFTLTSRIGTYEGGRISLLTAVLTSDELLASFLENQYVQLGADESFWKMVQGAGMGLVSRVPVVGYVLICLFNGTLRPVASPPGSIHVCCHLLEVHGQSTVHH